MKRLGLLWMVVYTAISCNVCWGMLSYPEENELHCRSCHAPSTKNTADRHHESEKAKTTGCLGCHPRNADTTLKEIVRDCKKCHVNPGTRDPFTGAATTKSPHHNSAINSECLFCHNVSTILNPSPDQYAGTKDPAPTPIVPERKNESISFPVTIEGVPQTLGVPDIPYGNLTPQDCKACHLRPGEESTANFHHQSARLETDGCSYCHVDSGGIQVLVQRNCLSCHVNKGVQDPFTGEIPQYTVHHRSAAALAEDCTACHSDTLVQPVGTGLSAPYLPTNPPSLVTPTMQTCRNCHSAGPTGVSTAKLHHTVSENCTLCHSFQQYETTIRDCQSCHTFESLHKIPGHTAGTDRCIGCHGDYLAYETPVLEVSPISRTIFTDNAAFNIAGRVFSSSGMSTLTINGEPVPFDEEGYFSHLQPLQPGLNNILISAIGANETETTETKEITLIGQPSAAETASPFTIKSPADNSIVSMKEVTIEGTSVKGASLSLKHNRIDAKRIWPRGKKFKTKVALTPGLNTLEFTYAKKGKQITKKRTVIYTPLHPALAITIPGQDTVTAEQVVNLQGVIPKGAVVTVSLDTETVATFNAAGKFTLPVYFEEERKYTIQMTAVDADGRATTAKRNIIFKRK